MTKLKQTYRSMSTPCLSLASMASAQVLVKSWTSQNQAEEDGEFAVQTETTFCKPGEEREAFFPYFPREPGYLTSDHELGSTTLPVLKNKSEIMGMTITQQQQKQQCEC